MTENQNGAPGASTDKPQEDNLTVYSENVALPEVRTGKVDMEGDFAKDQSDQSAEHENQVSYDTVAVPEYKTGKRPTQNPHSEDDGEQHEHKHRNIFTDLARTLVNGSADD